MKELLAALIRFPFFLYHIVTSFLTSALSQVETFTLALSIILLTVAFGFKGFVGGIVLYAVLRWAVEVANQGLRSVNSVAAALDLLARVVRDNASVLGGNNRGNK